MSGKEFRRLRKEMGLSQEALGNLIDVSTRGLRRWENGEVTIPKIAEFAMLYLAEKDRKKGNR